jgi:uncharacterized protein (DUF952 family)
MIVYKILRAAAWSSCGEVVPWSDDDRRDGFMHLSTAAQALETADKHFKGATDLLALEIDERAIAAALKYEPSRGGAPFPHLYGELPRAAVIRVRLLVQSAKGRFAFADDAP